MNLTEIKIKVYLKCIFAFIGPIDRNSIAPPSYQGAFGSVSERERWCFLLSFSWLLSYTFHSIRSSCIYILILSLYSFGLFMTEDRNLFIPAEMSKYGTSVVRISKPQNQNGTHEASYLFRYLILTQVFVYLEAGAVPSLLQQFSDTFYLNPQEQGLLGAVVFFALSLASPLCGYLFKHYDARNVLGWSLVINNISVVLFAATPVDRIYSVYFLIFFRGIIGFTQAFVCVYSPLWVHEYAPKVQRARWMSYLQGAVPIGVTVGYLIASVAIWFSNIVNGCSLFLCWRWPFLVQAVCVTPLCFGIFRVPSKHIKIRSSRRKSIVIIDSDEDRLVDDDDDSSRIDSPQHYHHDHLEGKFCSSFCALLSIPVFTFVVLGLSSLFFVVSGVQFWATLFLQTNTLDSEYVIHVAYLLVSGTGPILGVFFGGWLIDKYGGYAGADHQLRALQICSIVGIVAVATALPTSYFNTTYLIAIFLWIMLFCGGAILPACSGIVIAVAPRNLRPFAASLAYTSYNLLGYAAAAFVPGIIMNIILKYIKDCDAACTYRIGFRIVLFSSIWAFACLSAAWFFARRHNRMTLVTTVVGK